MQELIIKHSQGQYPIYIGKNLFKNNAIIRNHIRGQQILLITDTEVSSLYLPIFSQILTEWQYDHLILPIGEQQKNLENLSKIFDTLVNNGHHRDTTIIALGGGLINDIAGFAAACYHRGVNFITVPTTLLAQIDASIGGKTAINHSGGKNLIGAFHQPAAVIIDIDFLSTLPERHFRAGIAEIIKAAVISDADFFDYLENNLSALLARDPSVLINAISRACQIKINIVHQDEKELNLRAILNFGHTIGHAIEGYFQYQHWLHGEAVALGMIIASRISQQMTALPAHSYSRIVNLIEQTGLPTKLPENVLPQNLLPFISSDKKIINNELRWILISEIGQAKIVPVSIQDNFFSSYFVNKL